MDNNEIRKSIKEKRNLLKKSTIKSDSKKIFNNLLSLELNQYKNFFIYNSFKSEVDTKKIIDYFLKQKKQVAIPIILGDKMVAGVPKGKGQNTSKFGTKEPKEYEIMSAIDVCIIPLLACDLEFNRLGYGKGYYDKFLKDKECLKIGICYDFQVVEKIESKPWDVPLDIIITETKIIKREK
jgi:5-formyltetrahydrofolate cyclo-ligase